MVSVQRRADADRLAGAAADAVQRGWAIFPCRPGGKRPAFPNHDAAHCTGRDPWCRGGHTGWEPRATTELARIRRAWARAAYNLGIACGPSGLVVVDLDSAEHGEVEDDWRELGVHNGRDALARVADWAGQSVPETFTVRTPSGGSHLYFRAPEGCTVRNSAGAIAPLVDVRGRGGYIVGPGSVIAGRAYQVIDARPLAVLPGWLCRLAAPGPVQAARRAATGAAGPPDALEARIRGLVAHVAAGMPGDRNGRLYWAACRAGELTAAGRVDKEIIMEQLVTAAVAAGLQGGEFEARRTAASGLRAGGGL